MSLRGGELRSNLRGMIDVRILLGPTVPRPNGKVILRFEASWVSVEISQELLRRATSEEGWWWHGFFYKLGHVAWQPIELFKPL